MKILYLALDRRLFINNESGGSTHIKSIIAEWEKLGHEVKLMTSGVDYSPSKGGYNANKPTVKKLIKKIIPSSIWLILRDISDILYSQKKYREVVFAINEFKPDIIYERNCYLCNAGTKAAEEIGVPYFVEINAPIEERKNQFGAPLSFYHTFMERTQYRLAKGVFVVASALRDYYINEGCNSQKIMFTPNGVNPSRFIDCDARGQELLKKRNLKDKCVVGFVGKVAKYHSFDRLVNAAIEVCSNHKNVIFWIVGNSANLDEFKVLLEKEGLESFFIFEGSVDKDKIPDYLGAFDIAILPDNPWYGSPTKLFEYAASGTATIAPKTPAVVDVFSEEDCMLVDSEDSLTEAIIELIENPDKRKTLSQKMKTKVINNYKWENIAKNTLSFIKKNNHF